MSNWLDSLDSHVICHESARYVGIFLSVLRVRPRDDEEDARSDEEVSDEETFLTSAELTDALKTWIGGRASEGDTANGINDNGKGRTARTRMCRYATRTWHLAYGC